MPNGLFFPYKLDESINSLGDVCLFLLFYFHLSYANCVDPDQTP